MSCTINAMAATLRQVSRYLDEISFLPELEHPFSTRTETDSSGVTRVSVYLAATSASESEAIERLCHLAGELGGRFHLGEPIRESDGGTEREDRNLIRNRKRQFHHASWIWFTKALWPGT